MNNAKSIAALLVTIVCATATFADAGQRSQGRSSGRAPNSGTTTGRAVPRGGGPRGGAPQIIYPRVIGSVPYRPYYYPYRPGFALGLYAGYGYPYGYAYPYYPYSYGYGYPSYAYGPYSGYGYGLPPAGYVSAVAGAEYGGVRIQGAPDDAQVFVDGNFVGIAGDFNGAYKHLNLQAGAHGIEIQEAGRPPIGFDVNVQPGQTVTYHADVR